MSSATLIRSRLLTTLRVEGRQIVITRNTGSAYNTSTGRITPSTDDDEFKGWARVGSYDDRVIDGKQVEASDRRVTFIPDEVDYTDPEYIPKVGDVVNLDDSTDGHFTAVNFKTRELGGELICYTLQIRNA